jgi:hypothetical protein
MLSAAATVLLIAPVAYHRLVFRRGLKEHVVRFANRIAILGLAAVGAAVLASLLLLTWYVAGLPAGGLLTAVIGVMIAAAWLTLPLVSRRDQRP